jgi:hypothetical protein
MRKAMSTNRSLRAIAALLGATALCSFGLSALTTAPASAIGACQGLNVISGTPRDDVLVGTPGPDLILGWGGDDVIDGKGGNDCLYGYTGDDLLIGGTGTDKLYGGWGSDRLAGGESEYAYDPTVDEIDGGDGEGEDGVPWTEEGESTGVEYAWYA